jgi:hypothetical protein
MCVRIYMCVCKYIFIYIYIYMRSPAMPWMHMSALWGICIYLSSCVQMRIFLYHHALSIHEDTVKVCITSMCVHAPQLHWIFARVFTVAANLREAARWSASVGCKHSACGKDSMPCVCVCVCVYNTFVYHSHYNFCIYYIAHDCHMVRRTCW